MRDTPLELPLPDYLHAVRGGILRRDHGKAKGRIGARGFAGDYASDILGYCAEVHVSRATGLAHNGVNAEADPDLADVGECLQVRATRYPDGRLPVYLDARPGDWYVLAVGHGRRMWIRGAMLAAEAMSYPAFALRAGFAESHNVPQAHLHAIIGPDGTRYPASGLEDRPPLVVAVVVEPEGV